MVVNLIFLLIFFGFPALVLFTIRSERARNAARKAAKLKQRQGPGLMP